MSDKYLLTNGKDRYIRYKHYMDNDRPETWGQACIESNYLLATRYTSWEQATKELKRLKKVVKGYHVANENEKGIERSNLKSSIASINPDLSTNIVDININTVDANGTVINGSTIGSRMKSWYLWFNCSIIFYRLFLMVDGIE